MKTATFKKFFAALLTGVMALCLLAGCGNEPAPETTAPVAKDPTAVGMLVMSADAALNISYDADGLVLKVAGINNPGITLASSYTDYVGKPCATVAKELIAAAAQAGILTQDVKNIVVKQTIRSQLPGSHFLETIETEVKAAAETAGSAAAVTVIDETMLDENGYINLDTAKILLCNELGVEKLDKYYGSGVPEDGAYICTAEIAGNQTFHNIDAVTGLITEATEDELLGDPEGMEDPEFEYEEETPSEPTSETTGGTLVDDNAAVAE